MEGDPFGEISRFTAVVRFMLEKFKKIVLSLSVVVLFALYAFQEKYRPVVESASVSAGQVATSTRVPDSPPTIPPATDPPDPTVSPTATATRQAATKTPTETAPGSTATTRRTTPTKTATAAPSPTSTPEPSPTSTPDGAYADGTYTGDSTDAHWGDVQVQVEIAGGQIADVQFLTYPDHRSRSRSINDRAMPTLIEEAIESQQADVDVVTGATDTSDAFIESLASALDQAAR